MVESYNKALYKLLLLAVKYLPAIIAIIYFICIIIGYFGIQLIIIPNLFFMSPIMALFILLVSFVFKCCVWHRLPIYYSLIEHGLVTIEYYVPGIFLSTTWMFVHLLVVIIFIILGMYFKNKYNVERKRIKTSTS